MSPPNPPLRPERRHYPPERSFALRFRAAVTADAGELAGQLEHVMSGRCTDFTGERQLLEALIEALRSLQAAPAVPVPSSVRSATTTLHQAQEGPRR
jgi:hypothetical protein